MSSFKTLLLAGAAAGLTAAAAQAADLGPPPPPLMQPVPVELSGWYLRGNIGMTNQNVKSIGAQLYHYDTIREL
jgi:opacity protein-like surface antigen